MLIGHKEIIEDLRRLAKSGELSHGYIFFGPSMVGKRMAATHFANFLETGDFAEPKILSDEVLIGPDEKGTLGIDAVRELKNFLSQRPNTSPRRTAIIDGGEFLTPEAQNALLKITEEPPPSSLLILITSDIDGLLPTIPSRLQKIYFGTVSQGAIAEWLMAEHKLAKKAADDLAKRSFGKPGLAARLLHDKDFQAILKSAEQLLKLSLERRRDVIKKLLEDEEFDLAQFLDALILHLAESGSSKKENITRWHKFLALRQNAANFNVNPKLQLEALLTN